jgi:large subunit ribosomal protein L21
MYAIIQSGGHQLKVTPGAYATVAGTVAEPGATVTIDQVLLVEKDGGEILAGVPFVANAKVVAVVEGEVRGPKIRVFKKKRRKGMRRTNGHRAFHTRLRIKDILL